MTDREKVIKGMEQFRADLKPFCGNHADWERFDAGLSMLKEQEEQIKNRDESLEKAREEIKWLRGMLKEQESTLNRLRSTMEDMVRGNASEEVSYLLRLMDKWEN